MFERALEGGDLAQTPFAAVLLSALQGRATGVLTVAHGAGQSQVFFNDGSPVGAKLAVGVKPLGHVLLSQGVIDIEVLDKSLQTMAATGRNQGEILLELGVTREQLAAALLAQHQGYLRELAALESGPYRFDPHAALPPWTRNIKLSPPRLIVDALALPPATLMRAQALQRALEGAVSFGPAYSVLAETFEWQPDEAAAVARFAQPTALDDFFAASGLAPERAQAILAGLLLLDLVEVHASAAASPQAWVADADALFGNMPAGTRAEAVGPLDEGAPLGADPGADFDADVTVDAAPLYAGAPPSFGGDFESVPLESGEEPAGAPILQPIEQDEPLGPAHAAPPPPPPLAPRAPEPEPVEELQPLAPESAPPPPPAPAAPPREAPDPSRRSDPDENKRRRQRMLQRAFANIGVGPLAHAADAVSTASGAQARPPTPAKGVAKPDAPPPAPTPPPPSVRTDHEQLRKEVADAAAKAPGQDFFARLGLQRAATRDQVKHAFFQLAKKFHPDRFNGQLADLQPTVKDLFVHLNEAYETLSDDARRAGYLSTLQPQGAAGSAPQSAGDVGAVFKRAEAALKKRDYGAARKLLEDVVKKEPKPLYLAELAWSCLLDPAAPDRVRAKHLVAQALSDPNCDRACYVAAIIARDEGNETQAEKMFRLTLRANPDNVDAQREVRLIDLRRDKHAQKQGGISGLFKIKK